MSIHSSGEVWDIVSKNLALQTGSGKQIASMFTEEDEECMVSCSHQVFRCFVSESREILASAIYIIL